MISNKLLCCMAFADDLLLITVERIHMQILKEQCNKFFDKKGLAGNTGKCASLRVGAVPTKKSMKVITKEH